MFRTCERCSTSPTIRSRRFRCYHCKRLVCARCCRRGGHGVTHRWAECRDCEGVRAAALKAVR